LKTKDRTKWVSINQPLILLVTGMDHTLKSMNFHRSKFMFFAIDKTRISRYYSGGTAFHGAGWVWHTTRWIIPAYTAV